MWGAVIGDIAGSIYEWNRIKTKDFDLFGAECEYTDDTVCTAAVASCSMICLRRQPCSDGAVPTPVAATEACSRAGSRRRNLHPTEASGTVPRCGFLQLRT